MPIGSLTRSRLTAGRSRGRACPLAAPVRVLVADDEDDIRDLVCLAVRKAGCSRRQLGGRRRRRAGRRPLPTCPTSPSSTCRCPGATGLEVCAALRADPATAGIAHPAAVGRRLARRRRPRPGRRRRRLPAQALLRRRAGRTRSATLTGPRAPTRGMTTAVLGRSSAGSGTRRGLIQASPSLVRALPTTALLAATTVLFTVGVLPVVDGELVGAGLALGFLATGVARAGRPHRGRRERLVVPVAQFGAIALISAGSLAPSVLFLLLGPVLSLALTPRRRAAVVAVLGTAAVLLLPGLLHSDAPAPIDLPLALFLGPLSAGLVSLAGQETARRSSHQAAELERAACRAIGPRDAGADPRRRARPGHPDAGRPRPDDDQRHRRRHRAVDHRHRPRRRDPRLEPGRGEDARAAARRRRPEAVDRGVPPARGARGGRRGAPGRPPAWPRWCTPPRRTAATSGTGPTWPPTARSAPCPWRSPRAPTTTARTPAGTSSAPT